MATLIRHLGCGVGITVGVFAGVPPAGAQALGGPPPAFSGQVSIASLGITKGLVDTGTDPQIAFGSRLSRGPWFVAAKIRNFKNGKGAVNQQEYAVGLQKRYAALDVDLHLATKVNGGQHLPRARWTELEAVTSWRPHPGVAFRVQADLVQGDTRIEPEIWADVSGARKLSDALDGVYAFGLRYTPNLTYRAANLGVIYRLRDRLDLDLRYYDTDQHARGDRFRGHVIARVTGRF